MAAITLAVGEGLTKVVNCDSKFLAVPYIYLQVHLLITSIIIILVD